jgi:hypothetical protein
MTQKITRNFLNDLLLEGVDFARKGRSPLAMKGVVEALAKLNGLSEWSGGGDDERPKIMIITSDGEIVDGEDSKTKSDSET